MKNAKESYITEKIYLERLEKLSEEVKEGADISRIRDEMQDVISGAGACFPEENAAASEVIGKTLRVLKKLYNLNSELAEKAYTCNVTELFDNLAFCCELLCSENRKRIIFSYEEDPFCTVCNPKELSWAFLNILVNAAAHSRGDFISVTQRTGADFAQFIIENEGEFRYGSFADALCKNGCGLFRTNRIISSHGGVIMMNSDSNKTAVSFTVSKKTDSSLPEYKIPSVEDLLYDRLSIIYTALSGIIK